MVRGRIPGPHTQDAHHGRNRRAPARGRDDDLWHGMVARGSGLAVALARCLDRRPARSFCGNGIGWSIMHALAGPRLAAITYKPGFEIAFTRRSDSVVLRRRSRVRRFRHGRRSAIGQYHRLLGIAVAKGLPVAAWMKAVCLKLSLPFASPLPSALISWSSMRASAAAWSVRSPVMRLGLARVPRRLGLQAGPPIWKAF